MADPKNKQEAASEIQRLEEDAAEYERKGGARATVRASWRRSEASRLRTLLPTLPEAAHGA